MSESSALTFPCVFPIKVFGRSDAGLETALYAIATGFDTKFNPTSIKIQKSKQGNYVSVTLNIHAESLGQLDDLYKVISAHEAVIMAL